MKFLFLDEFKYDLSKKQKVYGVVGVVIDAQYYLPFRESFEKALQQSGWNKALELKGRSMFSTKGDSSVSVEKRVSFMSNVVEGTASGSGKSARVHVYVSFDVFSRSEPEENCYIKCVQAIVKKQPKAPNKKKSLTALFYDQNDSVRSNVLNKTVGEQLTKRSLNLFESVQPVVSSLENPGIMFADYVCYFHQTFLQLSKFRKSNLDELLHLLQLKNPDEAQQRKLDTYIVNYKKETKTKELIVALKKVVYV